MFNELSKLEECRLTISNIKRTINMVECSYFSRRNIKDVPKYIIEQKYADIQAILSNLYKVIDLTEKELQEAINSLYEEKKG